MIKPKFETVLWLSDMQDGRNARIATCRFSRYGEFTNSLLCNYEIADYDSFFEILKN